MEFKLRSVRTAAHPPTHQALRRPRRRHVEHPRSLLLVFARSRQAEAVRSTVNRYLYVWQRVLPSNLVAVSL
jgi:hypothetical protein